MGGLDPIASVLIAMHSVSVSQAGTPCSACMLFPGLEQLRFLAVLKPYKRKWNTSTARYVDFYDPFPVFVRLCNEPLDWTSRAEVRTRLIFGLAVS